MKMMKKLNLTKHDVAPLSLLLISLPLLIAGLFLKNLVVVAGITGLLFTWFLCIDTIIVNHQMNWVKRIVFGSIVILLPIMFAVYLGS